MKKQELPDLSWLEAYRTASPNFGLERMERLLELRGNPHLQLPVIHIAGTNGKGSTIAHLRQLLGVRDLRVGTFTSPYLVSYNEQIAINGNAISDQDLQRLLSLYQELFAQHGTESGLQGVTEFEIVTALAYDYFVQQQVDVAIIEVGMGGLLDSTNVCQPLLTAITTVGLDHVALLGNSLEAIAQQKAGIIKPGVPLVTGRLEPEAMAVVEQKAAEKDAPLFSWSQDYQVEHQKSAEGESFSFSNAYRAKASYRTALMGLHQADNAGLAIQLCDLYCQLQSLPLLTKAEVERALLATVWPGRLERISDQPLILLDGAHNPHALRSLAATLDQHYPTYRKQILFACIQTKALVDMVELLQKIPKAAISLTAFADPRSFSKESMQVLAEQQGLSYKQWPDYLADYLAVERESDELLLITGSLYFLAQVRKSILENRKLDFAERPSQSSQLSKNKNEHRSIYGHEEN